MRVFVKRVKQTIALFQLNVDAKKGSPFGRAGAVRRLRGSIS